MIVTLLLLSLMRLTIGVDIVSWSSHYATYCGDVCDAHALLDGDTNNGWNAYPWWDDPHWVIFDFREDVTLTRFDFMCLGDTTHDVKDFKLYYSDTSDKIGVWIELLSDIGASG
eukprot:378505_1